MPGDNETTEGEGIGAASPRAMEVPAVTGLTPLDPTGEPNTLWLL